jgi:hypothetical protein
MPGLTPLIIVVANICLGLLLLTQHLRGLPRKPTMRAAHLLLGAFALESLAVNLNDPGSAALAASPFGARAALLVGLALLTGYIAALVGRKNQRAANWILGAHATAATLGLAFLLVWVMPA